MSPILALSDKNSNHNSSPSSAKFLRVGKDGRRQIREVVDETLLLDNAQSQKSKFDEESLFSRDRSHNKKDFIIKKGTGSKVLSDSPLLDNQGHFGINPLETFKVSEDLRLDIK